MPLCFLVNRSGLESHTIQPTSTTRSTETSTILSVIQMRASHGTKTPQERHQEGHEAGKRILLGNRRPAKVLRLDQISSAGLVAPSDRDTIRASRPARDPCAWASSILEGTCCKVCLRGNQTRKAGDSRFRHWLQLPLRNQATHIIRLRV